MSEIKLQEGITPILDSIVMAATQNFDQALFGVLTVDNTDFQGFDRQLCWILTVDHWLSTHLQKYTEECVATAHLP